MEQGPETPIQVLLTARELGTTSRGTQERGIQQRPIMALTPSTRFATGDLSKP